ncbi:hypothetical protein MHYP_G00329630 [Metynnis hypsauchen]
MHHSAVEEILDSSLFIAVDFGTAFSGYCFQFSGGEQIRMPKWGLEYGYDTPKTPTCILFNEDGEFLKFGYEAVMTYRNTPKNDAQKLCYFDNFKMELYGKEIHRDLMIKATNGKEMRALKVFSEGLKFMKDHAMKMVGKHTSGRKFLPSDATWVLTVPAIWSSAAKQFMREAATEAGLVTESDPERLIIALEPEAASVWCKKLPSEGFMEADLAKTEKIEEVPGTQYMVVDCGGGTIDITVHEVVDGGHLKELHSISGNDMGGQRVDKNFSSFLRKIFSDKMFDEFMEDHPAELQRLMYDFSTCKRYDGNILLPFPHSLQNIAEKSKSIEDYLKGISGAEWESGQILLTQEKMRSLHDDSLRAIERLIRDILKKPNLKIRYLLLVGGFALSPYVNKFVREKFGSRCTVICPVEAQLAVLKGAVMFGMMPNVVESRISLFTYGVSECEEFNESKHRGKSTFLNKDGVKYCNVCFYGLVQKDESVRCDEVRDYIFGPVERDQTSMQFRFYCTESKSPEFVDEEGMKKIGSFLVSMPDVRRGFNRSVRLEVKFGFTEMKATATDIESGETSSVKLDFMSQELNQCQC